MESTPLVQQNINPDKTIALDTKSKAVTGQKAQEPTKTTGKTNEQTQVTEKKTEVKEETKQTTTEEQGTEEEKKVETSSEEEPEEDTEEDFSGDNGMLENAVENGMQISFLIVCIVVALIKDILEIILFVTGVGNIVSFIISVPFSLLLTFLLILSQRKGNFDAVSNTVQTAVRIAPYIIDGIPVISVLPLSTVFVFIAFASRKNSKKLKNLEQKTGQADSLLKNSDKIQGAANKTKSFFSKISSKI